VPADFVYGSARLRSARAAISRFGAPSHRWLLAIYAIFAVLLFIAFLVASFPYADTLSSICAPIQLRIVYRSQRMSFPMGARLEDLQVISTAMLSNQIVFRSPEVVVAPTLASLVFGHPGISISTPLYGGEIHAVVNKRRDLAVAEFKLYSVNLAQVSALLQSDVAINGELSGSGSLQVKGNLLNAGTGQFTVNGRKLTLAIFNTPLRLGTVAAQLSLAGNLLTIHQAEAHGADASIRANGELLLGPDPADSDIELIVSLTPTQEGSARFGPLIKMLPHPPEAGDYRISGRLISPAVH
jgi:type II secretion system protein N